ncbi:MAG: ATP-binding protein, partial [Desulfurococcaceae archaeon]
MKNAAVLFTGGKDSTYALHKAVESGLRVSVLLTVVPYYKYSMLYHPPYFSVLVSQAQSLGIPLESIGLYDKLKELDAL